MEKEAGSRDGTYMQDGTSMSEVRREVKGGAQKPMAIKWEFFIAVKRERNQDVVVQLFILSFLFFSFFFFRSSFIFFIFSSLFSLSQFRIIFLLFIKCFHLKKKSQKKKKMKKKGKRKT